MTYYLIITLIIIITVCYVSLSVCYFIVIHCLFIYLLFIFLEAHHSNVLYVLSSEEGNNNSLTLTF